MQTLNTITAEEAKSRLEDLLARAQHGEEWIITDASGQPIAKLEAPPVAAVAEVPPDTSHASLFGSMPGIKLLPGWDDPLEEFAEYM